MNLSPQWVSLFRKQEYEAIHWINIGEVNATDQEIMDYARDYGYIIFTHDLDFGDILAASGGNAPSVLQARTTDTTPEVLGPVLMSAIDQFKDKLESGALVTISPGRMRARVLPLKS